MNLREWPPGGWKFRDTDGFEIDDMSLSFGAAALEIMKHRLGHEALRNEAAIDKARADLLAYTCRRLPYLCGPGQEWQRNVIAGSSTGRSGGCSGCH